MSGHIFLSYSRKDIDYVNRLYDWLVGKGFNVWQDVNQLDAGSKWPQEIRDAIDKCGAFILVMTPDSEKSDFVQNEILRAKEKKKEIIPLQLTGKEPWFLLANIQMVDVRAGVMPPPYFLERLSKFATRRRIRDEEKTFNGKSPKQDSPRSSNKKNFSYNVLFRSFLYVIFALLTYGVIAVWPDIKNESLFINILKFSSSINSINIAASIFIPVLIGLGLILLVFLYTHKSIEISGFRRGSYLSFIMLLEVFLLAAIIYLLPKLIAAISDVSQDETEIRWVIIYLTVIPAWYLFTREYSGIRGTISMTIILTIFQIGWLYGQWIGIVLVTLPILLIFLYVISKLIQVIFPFSSSEYTQEYQHKKQALISYLLGIQYPFWGAFTDVGREFRRQINGDNSNKLGGPGIIYTFSHQVAATSNGYDFKVQKPGIIFTEENEAPIAIVDLRPQYRTEVVDAITKDGIPIQVFISFAFSIDQKKWPKEEWDAEFALKMINKFEYNFDLDNTEGEHPFSSNRIAVALKKTGIYEAIEKGEHTFYWDLWVKNQIEDAIRSTISERTLNELSLSITYEGRTNPLDDTSNRISDIAMPRLLEIGVALQKIRVITLDFYKNSDFTKTNLETVSGYWEDQVNKLQRETETIFQKEIEDARNYSKKISMDVLTESLEMARNIRPDLPRHVITHYYIHVLEEYINELPKVEIKDTKQRIEKIKDLMKYNDLEENE